MIATCRFVLCCISLDASGLELMTDPLSVCDFCRPVAPARCTLSNARKRTGFGRSRCVMEHFDMSTESKIYYSVVNLPFDRARGITG